MEKGVRQCHYDTKQGETRFQSLKTKNDGLSRDMTLMRQFVDNLRSSSTLSAQKALDELRSSSDPLLYIRSSAGREQARVDSDHDESSTSGPPGSRSSHAALHGTDDLRHQAHDQSIALGDARHTSTMDNQSSSSSDSAGVLDIHNEPFLRRAVSAYRLRMGKLFQVFTTQDTEALFDRIFRHNDGRLCRAASCQLYAVAAVGSQYMRGELEPHAEKQIYTTATSFLEDVVDLNSLSAAKSCAMIAMFNVMSKEKIALTYIGKSLLSEPYFRWAHSQTPVEMGLSLLRQFGAHHDIRPLGIKMAEWVDGRRVWRTLLFLHR